MTDAPAVVASALIEPEGELKPDVWERAQVFVHGGGDDGTEYAILGQVDAVEDVEDDR